VNHLLGLKDFETLRGLRLAGLSRSTIFDLFAEKSWSGSEVLESLEITACSLVNDYGRILSCLPQSLVRLSLASNDIDDLKPLARKEGLPKGIRKLGLASRNPVRLHTDSLQRQFLCRVLDAHPQLGHISIESDFPHWNDANFGYILYKMFLNESGRVLLISQGVQAQSYLGTGCEF
jgi:hypothetical protein